MSYILLLSELLVLEMTHWFGPLTLQQCCYLVIKSDLGIPLQVQNVVLASLYHLNELRNLFQRLGFLEVRCVLIDDSLDLCAQVRRHSQLDLILLQGDHIVISRLAPHVLQQLILITC